MITAVRAGFQNQLRLFLVLIAGHHVPLIARGVIVLAIYYVLGPIDLIPNSVPVFGYADDVAVIWLSWFITGRLIPAEFYHTHSSRLEPALWSVNAITDEVWVLADDRVGHTNQSLGVAEKIGCPVKIKNVRYTNLIRLPNFMRETSLMGFDAESVQRIHGPWPKLVIGTGRRMSPALRFIKMASGGQTKIIQILNPEAGYKDFDLIVIPNHDYKFKQASNVLRATGALNRVTLPKLKKEAEEWQQAVAHLPQPWVAVLIGGDTRFFNFTETMAAELGRLASKAAHDLGGSLLITTSRRTNPKIADAFLANVNVPAYVHRWASATANPFFGFLGLADYIVVTGDSMSMCSEACASEKPVYVYAPSGMLSAKFERLHKELYDKSLVRPFDGHLQKGWEASTVNPTDQIAEMAANLLKI
ncbi:MAG: mitochondrial fission ELM1 family protein [Alphaproteobacteria bacterium]|nr:mitochondrial fission ELM1 family protein [Alphaproteobacteria bacterium]